MKPNALEVTPRATASCAHTNNCFEQILPNGKLTDAWLLGWFRREMAHVLLLPCAIALCSDPRMEESLRKVSMAGRCWYFGSLSVDDM